MVTSSHQQTQPMRKIFWLASPFILSLTLLFIFTVNSSLAADDGLRLIAPTECPDAGCAAGQRLNFSLQFTVSPKKTDPNTQVCIYTPAAGQADSSGPWADFTSGWISDFGLLSIEEYTQGEVDAICKSNTDEDEQWLTGAYAHLKTATTDQLEFTLHIHPDADMDGYITAKVFEPVEGNGAWIETSFFSIPIPVVARSDIVYVAASPDDCDDDAPCYVNSGDDLDHGLGTGLRDAILAVDAGDGIHLRKGYTIKDSTVLVDKEVVIKGDENALITYVGTECTQPMLLITEGATISELTINDGNCFNPSRNLIEVDSPDPVAIKNNTLVFGNQAIFIHDNFGDVTITFNHVVNNDDYAVFRELGKSTGTVNIIANNIINNRPGYQVDCNERGTANHNFWGGGQTATANANNCAVSNGKRLGALIQLDTSRPGVEAQRLTVTSTMVYAFDEKIGARHSAGNDFDIIIVNHGQGAAANIPFYQEGAGNIQPCSNFYDVFLADGAVATNLILALKYDLNSNCVAKIESSDNCGSTNSQNYPLNWFDPATNATDGWDRTGQNPQGPGAGGATGQETSCNLSAKEVHVIIDNSGRPGISSDLNFTPFVVGLPIVDGITLSQFTAQFDGSKVNLRWITTSEINTQGFYVLRSDSIDGTYSRVSSQITAIGNTHIGGIYQFSDTNITFSRTYFYKLEVIDINGNSIELHGPVSTVTSTATPTATQTRTPTTIPTATSTWTRSPTPRPYISPTPYYIFRTPTPNIQFRTATPSVGPTQFRTFGPSLIGTDGSITYPIDDIDPDSGYPMPDPNDQDGWFETPPAEGYPLPETPSPGQPTSTPDPEADQEDSDTPATGTDDEGELPVQSIRWIFIMVGVAGGLSLIGATSVILAGSRFS